MIYLGDFTTANTVYIPFHTFDSNDPSASVTLTGLALGDIKIYKNGSTTERTSTAGFTLLDTDGIDFDSITGIHGISIDLSDNTDAGFFAAGGEYWVVINSVTVDGATVNFVASTFSIERTGGALALLKHATYGLDALSARTPAALIGGRVDANVGAISADATAADNAEAFFDGTGYAGTGNVIPAVTTLTNLPTIPANWLTAAGTAADFTTEIQAGLATAASLATVAGYLDTEIQAILDDTNELQSDWANGGRLDLILDARASQTSLDTLDTIVDAILVDTDATIPGVIANLALATVKKNAAFSDFTFPMKLTSDHYTAATGKTVTATRSLDGGAFAAAAGTIAEISAGVYQFDALAADTNGGTVTWKFSAADCDDTIVIFKTSL
jgi:hypothetical protein